MRRWLLGLAFTLGPGVARADELRLVDEDDTVLKGRIVDGRLGDYVVLEREQGVVRVPWSQVRALRLGLGDEIDVRSKRGLDLQLPHPVRPTVALRGGWQSFHAQWFGPYVGSGPVLALQVGIHLHPMIAFSLVVEHGFQGPDDRNRRTGGTASLDLLGVGVRSLFMGRRGKASFHLEVVAGLRRVSYTFGSVEPDPRELGCTIPSVAADQRATLLGWEIRPALGITATWLPGVAFDALLAVGRGALTSYEDTLSCRTFRFGACGGGKDFPHWTTSVMLGARWN